MTPWRIVAFLSDFGLQDPYVGMVKAVLLGINRQVHVVDLTHHIPSHDVKAGAFVLGAAYRDFPEGTVFLAVVDPGVGTERAGLVAVSGPYAFVAPDNGLLSEVLRGTPRPTCYRLEEQRYFRQPVSTTFHGRDIFGPVAAHLTLGEEPRRFGPVCTVPVILPRPVPVVAPEGLSGRVQYVDRFGTLLTNLDVPAAMAFLGGRHGTVEVSGWECPLLDAYGDVEEGRPLALIGSSGFLEVAVNRGRAADMLKAGVGTPVTLRKQGEGAG